MFWRDSQKVEVRRLKFVVIVLTWFELSVGSWVRILPGMRDDMFGAIENGKWVWGLGDPSPAAIAVTFYYLGIAVLCAVVWRRACGAYRNFGPDQRPIPARAYWFLLTLLMFLLGINKQGDLQSLVTVYGREYVRELGLYEERRGLQQLFIQAVAATGGISILIFFFLMRRASWWAYLTIIGIVVQVVFIVIRASSFHHIDKLLGVRMSELGGVKYNLLLESVGLTLIFLGALGEFFRLRHAPPPTYEDLDDGLEMVI